MAQFVSGMLQQGEVMDLSDVISLIIFTFFRHGSPSDPKPAISPVTKYIFLSRDIRISVSKSFIVSIVNGCTGLGIQIISLLRF